MRRVHRCLQHAWGRALVSAAVLIVLYELTGSYQHSVLVTSMLYGVAAISITVLMGWAGQASLLSAGQLLLGQYCAAYCANVLHLNFIPSLVITLAIGGAFGALVALPARRVSGIYLLLGTLAMFNIMINAGNVLQTHDKAYAGYTIEFPTLFGATFDTPEDWYLISALALYACYEFFRYLRGTRVGRGWILVKEDAAAAQVAGISTQKYITAAFGATSAVTVLAGALMGYYLGNASYDSVTLLSSVNIVVMAVLGGLGSQVGAIAGALILTELPSLLNTHFGSGESTGFISEHIVAIEQIVFALIGLAVLLRAPQRLLTFATARRRGQRDNVDNIAEDVALSGEAGLTLAGVSVRYAAGELAVDGVQLHIKLGSATALVGRNGAGKTSLLHSIVGFPPDSGGRVSGGAVQWREGPNAVPTLVHRMPAGRRHRLGIVFIPAEEKVFDNLTVRQHLRDALATRRRDASAAAVTLESVLAEFPRLAERLDNDAGLLSGGEKQQLALAVATARNATLIAVDEASLGLAPSVIDAIVPMLRRLAAGGTLIIAEQNPAVALAVADTVALMDQARVVEFRAADDELAGQIETAYLGGSRLATE